MSGADGRLVGLVRVEPGFPTEVEEAVSGLGAAGGGGKGGKDLTGAEDEEQE